MSEVDTEPICSISTGSPTVPPSYPIPQQLRIPDARFIRVIKKSKNPVDKEWQTTNNYTWDDPKLVKWICEGGNYGFLPSAGISVIDIDDVGSAIQIGLFDELDTFTVKSGSGKGLHFYIKCDGIPEKIPFFDINDNAVHIGEFFGTLHAFVVGAGSTHLSGEKYEVTKNIPMVELNPEDLDEILFKKVKSKRFTSQENNLFTSIPKAYKTTPITERYNLRIEDFAMPINPKKRDGEIQGGHPIHGSTTGQNFSINPSKNFFHCFRHGCGGDPVTWIAIKEGFIKCEERVSGEKLPSDVFKKVKKWLDDNGYKPGGKNDVASNAIDPSTAAALLENYVMPTNPQLVLYLEDDNFILEYIRWASQKTDSYIEYQFAAALSVLSIVAQRNAIFRLNTGDIYPNIWSFLLGASSVSRKSTSIKLLNSIILSNETEKHQIPKSFSPEALVECLDESPKGYYINGEAAGFLKSFKKRYMEDVLDMLCDLYDGNRLSRRLTSKKNQKSSFNIPNPYITMILATTPDNFQASSSQDHFIYGLFYRYLWFYPNYSRGLMKLSVVDPSAITMEKQLQETVSDLWTFFGSRKVPVIFQLTPECMTAFNTWTEKTNRALCLSGEEYNLTAFARLQEYALKLAMLFTIGRRESMVDMDTGAIEIKQEHLDESIRLIESYFLPMVSLVYNNVDQASSTNDQKTILRALKELGGKTTRSYLLRKVRMKSKDLDDALHTLIYETKEINEVQTTENKNPVIYYMLQA